MTKRFALSNMILDECSFVDKGANPGAKVVFWKRDEAAVDPTRQNIVNTTLNIDVAQIMKAVQDAIAAVKNSEAVEEVKEMVGAAVKRTKVFLTKAGDWDESKHPREADGKFGGGGGVSSGADSGKTVDYVRAASALRSALKDFPPGKDPKLGVNRNEQARLKELLSRIGQGNTRFSEEDKRVLRQVISRTKKSASFTADLSKHEESVAKFVSDLVTLHKSCCEVAATSPSSIQPAVAATFDELLERQDVQERAQELNHMVYALQDSINSITNDPELRDDVRRDLLERSLNEFKAAVEEEMGEQPEEDYMAKATIQAAIAKSYLALAKHGDHDQSDHGNWADGGGGANENSPTTGSISVDGKERYASTHGKAPRGEGNWAFAIGNKTGMDDLFRFNGKYTAAVNAATAEARRRGARSITVQT